MSVDLAGCMKTPLFDAHVAAGARMVPFGGWAMPVQYEGILAEHERVRTRVGLFDVSHMGELLVEGPGAEAFLNRIVSNDVTKLAVGQAQYSVMCQPDGGIVDDLLVYRRGAERFLVCINAACIPEDVGWFRQHHDAKRDACTLVDGSDDFAQLAIQGRHAEALLQPGTSLDLRAIPYYRFAEGRWGGVDCIVARTGYTGEDGFELFFARQHARALWDAVLAAGEPYGIAPIGLGARDTLRLEAKYCLYGQDITKSTNPLEAKLGWIVKLDKGDFIGRDALVAQKSRGLSRALAGFELLEKGIARHGMPVWQDGRSVGEVTSGAYAPSLHKSIGMCYLPAQRAAVGSDLEVEVRGKRLAARVVETPFYKRPY
jgi:aminomethyltransferase